MTGSQIPRPALQGEGRQFASYFRHPRWVDRVAKWLCSGLQSRVRQFKAGWDGRI